ncbi:MAG: uracil-xanthine permease family protein [Firmicutes bacterium]|nr:uracil-xanthine permease family protein [Bacillota bacterium]MDY5856140.1 uracil-xanthine permease family protein [Anaerovoracaceae bacterium]
MQNHEPIYDVRSLGAGKTLILGLQHTFAMFGATVLVPILTGLPISTTLLFAGLGTLLFHLLTKGQVPAFLGSSFAFLGGYAAVAPLMEDGSPNTEMLPYACGGVFCAGLVYLILSALIKGFGARKVMRFFPPVVTGPIIIAIGLILAPTAIKNCATNWPIAIIALVTVVFFNIWGRGMAKIVPILLGIIVSYAAAILMGDVSFEGIGDTAILGLPPITLMKFDISAIITIMPLALATMMEHIGDISAIGATTGKNYIAEPGLHRTLLGDGLATCLAAAFGAPANTTYGENTGVLALTKVYDPRVMRIAAVFAIILSCVPKVAFVIESIPTATIGGISFILYGMISAIGIRNVVENHVDFTRSRNTIIAALILVCALGFNSIGGISFTIAGATISLSGLAIASLVGIIVNAVLPGNEYVFPEDVKDNNDKFQTYKL